MKFAHLRGFTVASGFAATVLLVALWGWSWIADPVHAPETLVWHLAASGVLALYPLAVLSRAPLRLLPWLLYAALGAAQILFLLALSRLQGGLAPGAAGLVIWFLAGPLLGPALSLRAHLYGTLLLAALPNLATGALGVLPAFPLAQFNLLALLAGPLALFSALLANRLLARLYELREQVLWRSVALDAAEETVLVTNQDGFIEYVNPAFCATTGYGVEEVAGRKPSLLRSGKQDAPFYDNLWQTILRGQVWRGEIVNRRKDGEDFTEFMTISPVLGSDGKPTRFVAGGHDISARKHLEEEVARGNEELDAIFHNAGVGIALIDLWGRFLKVNDFWLGMLGYTGEEAAALNQMDITHDEDLVETRHLFAALARGELPHFEIDKRFVLKGGRVFWGHLSVTPVKDDAGYIRAMIGILQDINERKLLEDKLEAMAHYDALTGLPNRALFFDRLGQAVSQCKRSQTLFALMFVDLDGFKAVNDTFGHDTGDALLKAVSEHLLECVRESDTVARMGGDEFTLILRGIHGPSDAAAIAEKILATVSVPYHLLDHECRIGASLGIVLYPRDGLSAEELLSRADDAMYAVKKAGKNAYRFAAQLAEK